MADRVGQQLGNYKLIRLLGKGGFAEVYLGEHVYLNSLAAIKVLLAQLGKDETADFLSEARTLVALNHPHIVRVLDFGMEGDVPFLVMDYARNGTLRQRYPKGTCLTPATVVPYARQIASALQYAHNQRLIHRDVKPENMLIQNDDDILLSDFGVALIAQSTHLQSKQDVIGTATYMAPEQIRGKARPSSDQYALGVVVYEWLSGEPLFQGSFTEICAQHMFAAPEPLRQKMPTISPYIEHVVMTALAKEPQQRFANVQAFATALEQAYQSERSNPVALGSAVPPSSISPQPYTVHVPDGGPVQQGLFPVPQGPASQWGLSPDTQVSVRQSLQRRLRSPMGLIALLVALVLVLLVGAGGLLYYVTPHQPGQTLATVAPSPQAQVTATATAQLAPTPTVGPTATPTAGPTVTPTVSSTSVSTNPQDIYAAATSGSPKLTSSLTHQDANNWQIQTSNDGSACRFTGGAYHAVMTQHGYVEICMAQATNFSNFAFQVNMTTITGAAQDGGGLVFRSNGNAFYRLRIGVDGSYDLVNQNNGVASGYSSAIKTGLNQTNVITVVSQGQHIYMYVNKQLIANVVDGATAFGQIGVFAVSWTTATDVAYSNAQVWQL